MSITERSSLSQKETVYHEKTIDYGKKQFITELNSLSRKETVYHGKKLSIMERNSLSRKVTVYHRKKMSGCYQAYSNSITKADKYGRG